MLVMIALLFDLLNWIPIINWLVGIFSFLGFGLYFFARGIKQKYNIMGNLFEFLPFLSFLPAVTAGVVATIISNNIAAKVSEKVTKK